MGWEAINLTDVEQSRGEVATLPADTYNLRLLSVSPDKYRENTLAFDIVVTDGKYARYHIFPTLPAPKDINDWPAQAAAKLLGVLGGEQLAGESVMDAFNRIASNGIAAFAGRTKQYTTGSGKTKADYEWFSSSPVGVSVSA